MAYKLPCVADMHKFSAPHSAIKIALQSLIIGFVLSLPFLAGELVIDFVRFTNWIASGFPIATFPHHDLITLIGGDLKVAALLALAAIFYRLWILGKFGRPICSTTFSVDLPKEKAAQVVENYLSNIATEYLSQETKKGHRFIGLVYEERWSSLYLEVYVMTEPEATAIVSTAVSRPTNLLQLIDSFNCDFGESRGHCLDVRTLFGNHLNSGKARFRKPKSPQARAAIREAFVPLP